MQEKKEISELTTLFDTVVKGGYCIGCGACASLENSPVKMQFDGHKQLQATVADENLNDSEAPYLSVCPFSGKSLNEDEIGRDLFSEHAKKDDKLGYFINNYAGYVAEDEFRDRGSSGGMGTWILGELLKRKLVDYVIHIHQHTPDETNPSLFAYSVSKTYEDIIAGAKSRYYPIEMSGILDSVKNNAGKYAIVGIPCFIKTIRLLAYQDPILKDRIKFCIGLVCGHLKSASFAEMFSWQTGINPKDMTAIDFRTKLQGYGANRYGVTVSGKIDGIEVAKVSKPVNQLYGTNWGLGFFKYKACDFCDDVVAENADLTVGDAWLPKYVNETKGTNIIIVRNPVLDSILKEANLGGRLSLESLDRSDIVKSQNSGFNHRREGLSYRLFLTDKEGKWRPKKRVEAKGTGWGRRFKAIQKTRVALAKESHIAFKKALNRNSFDVFENEMRPLVTRYRKLYQQPLLRRILNKGKNIVKRLLNTK